MLDSKLSKIVTLAGAALVPGAATFAATDSVSFNDVAPVATNAAPPGCQLNAKAHVALEQMLKGLNASAAYIHALPPNNGSCAQA